MREHLASGDVTPIDVAYLEDRIAVFEHRPQTYGTQFGAGGVPQPIADPTHVDERRKAIGLGSMAEYRDEMRAVYGDAIKK